MRLPVLLAFAGALFLASPSPAFGASDPMSTVETQPLDAAVTTASGDPVPEPPPPTPYERARGIAVHLALVSIVFLPFQLIFPLVKRKARIVTGAFWIDVLYWYQGMLWPLFAFYGLSGWAARHVWGTEHWFPHLHEVLPFGVQLFLAIWAFDFIVYWRHRMEHTLTPLWWFHATHHSAPSVDPLTTGRLHVFELMLGAFLNSIVARIGFHPSVVALAFPLYLHWNFFIHANIDMRFSGPFKYIFVSPFMHQWHHATDIEARNKNVGVVFAWNDWLFGTAYHPNHAPTSFGLGEVGPGEEIGHTPIGHLVYPLKMAFLTTRRLFRRGPGPGPVPTA